MPRKVHRSLRVTVVADNPETLDGLLAYLGQAGVPTHGTRALREIASVRAPTTAVIVFPDDFAFVDVDVPITALRRAHPRILVVLVTREPHRFKRWAENDGKAIPALLLPKPSFGWTILDAVRSHANSDAHLT